VKLRSGGVDKAGYLKDAAKEAPYAKVHELDLNRTFTPYWFRDAYVLNYGPGSI